MYADDITESMDYAIKETNRRRKIQSEYNKEHNIIPKSVVKSVRDVIDSTRIKENSGDVIKDIAAGGVDKNGRRIGNKAPETKLKNVMNLTEEEKNMPLDTLIEKLTFKMAEAAGELKYEEAAMIRDTIRTLKAIQ